MGARKQRAPGLCSKCVPSALQASACQLPNTDAAPTLGQGWAGRSSQKQGIGGREGREFTQWLPPIQYLRACVPRGAGPAPFTCGGPLTREHVWRHLLKAITSLTPSLGLNSHQRPSLVPQGLRSGQRQASPAVVTQGLPMPPLPAGRTRPLTPRGYLSKAAFVGKCLFAAEQGAGSYKPGEWGLRITGHLPTGRLVTTLSFLCHIRGLLRGAGLGHTSTPREAGVPHASRLPAQPCSHHTS